MYQPPKSFFARLVEAAFLFVVAAWLVRAGIGIISEVWVWIVGILVLVVIVIIWTRIRQHYKNTHF